jgi:hypothetical protein
MLLFSEIAYIKLKIQRIATNFSPSFPIFGEDGENEIISDCLLAI